jgi:hypothetical protein
MSIAVTLFAPFRQLQQGGDAYPSGLVQGRVERYLRCLLAGRSKMCKTWLAMPIREPRDFTIAGNDG